MRSDQIIPRWWQMVRQTHILRDLLWIYVSPLTLLLLGAIPRVNSVYSGHGGLAWLMLPLAFPAGFVWFGIRIWKLYYPRRLALGVFAVSFPLYAGIAAGLAKLAAISIRNSFGLPVTAWELWLLAVSPIPLWVLS